MSGADIGLLWKGGRCTEPLEGRVHRELVETIALERFKWDIQVGDVATLAPFAVVISRDTWLELAAAAEALTREMTIAEEELARRPELWSELGMPSVLRRGLVSGADWTPGAARVVRFDFHPTDEGWRISEANSDVPGGYNEASSLVELMLRNWPELKSPGDPLARLVEALAETAGDSHCVAVIAAPGYAEDQQVGAGVAARLRRAGVRAVRGRPDQLRWRAGRAYWPAIESGREEEIGAIFRFFQAEWVERLTGHGWRYLFRGGLTPVCNPAAAIFSESKRFPLVWPRLRCSLPAWRKWLPESDHPWRPFFRERATWLWKAAYCNNGDEVVAPDWIDRAQWRDSLPSLMLRPRSWIAQRRFAALRVATPEGELFPCLGVYTVNGKAAGLYGRLSTSPVVGYAARDVAVLVDG